MKMNIRFMQTQFISKWCNDDAMNLSVYKIFYSSWKLALTMNTQYNEENMRTDKHELCSKLHKTP